MQRFLRAGSARGLAILIIAFAVYASSVRVQAQTRPSNLPKMAIAGSALQESSSNNTGETNTGTTLVGSMGITETVDEIMARQREFDAQPHIAQAPHEPKPEPKFEPHQQPN